MSKRGGYRRTPPLYALKFKGEDDQETEYEGLEVMARSLPLHEFLSLQKLQQAAMAGDPDASVTIIRQLADVIVSWNLVDDDEKAVPVAYAACVESGKPGEPGEPCSSHQGAEVPCEYTGMCVYDLPFILTIFYSWMEAVANIPNLSKNNSNDGGTSQELSIPMEVS